MPHKTIPRNETPVDAFLRQGVRHHQLGETASAGACYSKVLSLSPDHPDALHLSGVLAYQRGDAEQAILLIQKAIAADAAHPLFYHNLGNALREAGKLDAALSAHKRALKLNPEYAEAFFGVGSVLTAMGELSGAMSAFKQAAALEPGMAEAYFCMGNIHRDSEACALAIACYKDAIAANPGYIAAYRELGDTLMIMENWDEAITQYRAILKQVPDPAEIYFSIGNACLGKNTLQAAIRSYQKALDMNPDHARANLNLGLAYRRCGRYEDAMPCLKRAMRLAPHDADVDYEMGNLLEATGALDDAVVAYDAAIVKAPDHAKALCRKGNVQAARNEWQNAVGTYEQALALRPEYPECLHRLGIARAYCGDYESAIDCFNRALEMRPDMPQVYNSLGNAMKETNRQSEADAYYLKALALAPEFYEAWNNLGLVYKEQGWIEKAAGCFDKLLAIRPDFGVEVKKAMMLPLFYDDTAQMDTARAQFAVRLDKLSLRTETLSDPYRQVGMTNHNLALHGRNDRELREKIADFYTKRCPDLAWTSPDLTRPPLDGRKIRIGMLSRYLYNHTIGNLYAGVIKHLSREKFHVTVFRIPGKTDHLSREIDMDADEVVMLPADLSTAREIVAGHLLDILFFLEIGMDAWTYFLAFSRMAPVQLKRGFPVTSGIRTVDYFISSDHFETPDAQTHYSEKLIRLNRSGYCYRRPVVDASRVDRGRFGIPEKGRLYACLQSLFKFHPDFDPLLAGILRKDPRGYLLIPGGLHDNWKKRWLGRFNKAHSDVSDRIIFLPQLGRDDFIAMFVISDVVLDSIHFCGGNTTLECFANGVPVVTWPSPYMRGRLTSGFYRMMGMMDCVAKDLDDYVDIAVRLGTDAEWRRSVCRRVEERSHILFEDTAAVRELESVFEKLARKA